MARRRGFDEDESGARPTYPTKPRHSCVAHGCPVVAGIHFAEGETICRFHDGQPASQWQEITHKLRDREWMVRLCDWLFGAEGPHAMPDWPERAKQLAEGHGRPQFAPHHGEPAIRYAQRINSVLSIECCAEKRTPLPPRQTAPGGPVSVGAALHRAGL